jgi:hypothetical protein
VERIADKDEPSVVYRSPKFLNVFFPSKTAEHGRCYYHARKAEAARLMKANMVRRRDKQRLHREYLRRLYKLSGGKSYNVIKSI